MSAARFIHSNHRAMSLHLVAFAPVIPYIQFGQE